METSMANGEFKTVADLVNTAIEDFYKNQNGPLTVDGYKAWVVSEDGADYMKGLILRFAEEKKD